MRITENKKRNFREGGGAGVNIIFDNANIVFKESTSQGLLWEITGDIEFESYTSAINTSETMTYSETKGYLYFPWENLLKVLKDEIQYIDNFSERDLLNVIYKDRTTIYAGNAYIYPTMYGAGYISPHLDTDMRIDCEIDINDEFLLEYFDKSINDYRHIDFEYLQEVEGCYVTFKEETTYVFQDLGNRN